MDEVLYLNGYKVDIYEGKITRKIRIADIGDMENMKSSYSFTFYLPRTAKNTAFFDMLGTLGNVSRKPFQQIIANYIVDNVYLIQNGFAIVKNTSKGYSVNLIDGIKSLTSILGEKKLIDLPLSDLNHYIDSQVYVDSYANTEGYIYAVANFGTNATGTVIFVESQAPSIYAHTLFRRIFETAGFNIEGNFFTTNADYLSEVLVPQKGYTIPSGTVTETPKGTAITDTLIENTTSPTFIKKVEKFTISDVDLIGITIDTGNLVFGSTGLYRIQFDFDYTIFSTLVSVVVVKNGVNSSFITLENGTGLSKTVVVYFDLTAGDIIRLNLKADSQYSDGEYWLNYSVYSDISISLVEGGSLITPDLYLADITQIDFIKDIIKRYGLLVKPNSVTNIFEFESLENILGDFQNAEDWTKKLSGIGAENYNSGYAKINKALYNYPENISIPNNDGEIIIDNENAEESKEIIKSIYEIPKISPYGSIALQFVFLIPIWEMIDFIQTNSESSLKLMHVTKRAKTITAKLYDEEPGVEFTGNVPYLDLNNMSMQYFLDTYHANFKSVLENYKEIDMDLLLNSIDIYKLNFFRLKYLKQTQRYYYIDSVIHTAGKISKVKAIEVKY